MIRMSRAISQIKRVIEIIIHALILEDNIIIVIGNNKLNLWLTAPKGATPVNYTSATDWRPPSHVKTIG